MSKMNLDAENMKILGHRIVQTFVDEAEISKKKQRENIKRKIRTAKYSNTKEIHS